MSICLAMWMSKDGNIPSPSARLNGMVHTRGFTPGSAGDAGLGFDTKLPRDVFVVGRNSNERIC